VFQQLCNGKQMWVAMWVAIVCFSSMGVFFSTVGWWVGGGLILEKQTVNIVNNRHSLARAHHFTLTHAILRSIATMSIELQRPLKCQTLDVMAGPMLPLWFAAHSGNYMVCHRHRTSCPESLSLSTASHAVQCPKGCKNSGLHNTFSGSIAGDKHEEVVMTFIRTCFVTYTQGFAEDVEPHGHDNTVPAQQQGKGCKIRTWLLLSEQLQWPFSCASESKFQALSHGNIHEA